MTAAQNTIPADVAAVCDYERHARARVPAPAWAYLDGAAADGQTARANLAAYGRIALRSRVLRDLRGGHTRVELLGDVFDAPILVAPVAHQKLAHPEGELATVLGAGAARAGMVVSTQASASIEDVAAAAHAPLWFQLYIQHDREFTAHLVRRAEAAGCRALVLTVDAPVAGLRNAEQRAGFAMPDHARAVNLDGLRLPPARAARAGESAVFGAGLLDGAPTWKDLAWLAGLTRLPVLVKGILDPDDAREALAHGARGIIVSNHGGRALDGLPATVDALPAVAAAVAGRAPVLVDGGVRRGTDVLKALALGASAVLVGRPVVHGLATAGAVGVAHVLHLLRSELEVAMALTGCRTLADIGPGVCWAAPDSQAPTCC